MKSTLLKLLPISAAVLALSFATVVWADDTQTENTSSNDTETTNLSISKNLTHNVTDNITVNGNINVGSQATSLAKSVQELETVGSFNPSGLNQSNIADNVFQGGKGIADVNVGSGEHYMQDNAMALSSINSAQNTTSLDAEAFNMQKIENHAPQDLNTHISFSPIQNNSFIKDNAFSGFAGQANANVGSGAIYEQSNDVALSEGKGSSVTATADSHQVLDNEVSNIIDIQFSTLDNQAGILGNAFSGASGLMNSNVSSGISIGQNNNVAIAASRF